MISRENCYSRQGDGEGYSSLLNHLTCSWASRVVSREVQIELLGTQDLLASVLFLAPGKGQATKPGTKKKVTL